MLGLQLIIFLMLWGILANHGVHMTIMVSGAPISSRKQLRLLPL